MDQQKTPCVVRYSIHGVNNYIYNYPTITYTERLTDNVIYFFVFFV